MGRFGGSERGPAKRSVERRPVDSAHLREGIKPAMYGLVAIDGSHAAVDGHLLGRQHVDVGVLGKRRLREAVH